MLLINSVDNSSHFKSSPKIRTTQILIRTNDKEKLTLNPIKPIRSLFWAYSTQLRAGLLQCQTRLKASFSISSYPLFLPSPYFFKTSLVRITPRKFLTPLRTFSVVPRILFGAKAMHGGTTGFPKSVSVLPATFSFQPAFFSSDSLSPGDGASKQGCSRNESTAYTETVGILSSRPVFSRPHSNGICCIAHDVWLRRTLRTNSRSRDSFCIQAYRHRHRSTAHTERQVLYRQPSSSDFTFL